MDPSGAIADADVTLTQTNRRATKYQTLAAVEFVLSAVDPGQYSVSVRAGL